jgi:hypothetical protein
MIFLVALERELSTHGRLLLDQNPKYSPKEVRSAPLNGSILSILISSKAESSRASP